MILEGMVSHDDETLGVCIQLTNWAIAGTMSELWSFKSDPVKKISIPRSIQFYEGGKKVLIFILETGEM